MRGNQICEGVIVMAKKKVSFRFKAPEDSKKVSICGEFTNWEKNPLEMKKVGDNEWIAEIELEPGEYEYKVCVDGVWYNDPNANKQVPNYWGSENSVVIVK